MKGLFARALEMGAGRFRECRRFFPPVVVFVFVFVALRPAGKAIAVR